MSSPVRDSKGQQVLGEASAARRTRLPVTGVAGRRRRGLEPDADKLGAPPGRAPGLGGDLRGGWTAGPAPPDHRGGGISPPAGLHAPQAAAGSNPASSRRHGGVRCSESDTEQPRFPGPDSVPRLRPGSPGVRASAFAASAAAAAAAAPVTARNPGRGRAGGRGGQGAGRRAAKGGTRGVGLSAPDRPEPGQHHLRSCGAHAAATPPPLAPATHTRARKQNKLQVAAAGGGPGGSLTLILLSGLGSSGREDREDQRTTSPRKLPTTSKLRKMNPIFSLIFLRRRETHSPAQPPPPLSPPFFPLPRPSSSSSFFPHPDRYARRPPHRLPSPAPDPELPSALPSPGSPSPPPPRACHCAPLPHPPPLRRPPQSSDRPEWLALQASFFYLPALAPQSPPPNSTRDRENPPPPPRVPSNLGTNLTLSPRSGSLSLCPTARLPKASRSPNFYSNRGLKTLSLTKPVASQDAATTRRPSGGPAAFPRRPFTS